jgi:predicted amidohydrolase YtcJ
VPADPILRPYRRDLDVVSAAAAPVVLIRPDGHVAARGRPGNLETVAGYLRDLFSEPAGHPGAHPEDGALNAVRGTAADQR